MSRLDALLAFHAEDPDDGFVRFAIATEYLKDQNLEAALAWFEGLVADQPDYVGTYYHLGRLYGRLGRPGDAERTLDEGIVEAGRQGDHHARAELERARLEFLGTEGGAP